MFMPCGGMYVTKQRDAHGGQKRALDSSPGARAIGSCEPPDKVLETELGTSERALCTCNTKLSLYSSILFFYFKFF